MTIKLKALIIASAFGAMGLASPAADPEFQSEKLTKKELKVLLASATTTADHQRIAAYYRGEASRLLAKRQEHERELGEYLKNPWGYPSKYPNRGDHCRDLAAYYGTAAKKALARAEMHEQLARQAR